MTMETGHSTPHPTPTSLKYNKTNHRTVYIYYLLLECKITRIIIENYNFYIHIGPIPGTAPGRSLWPSDGHRPLSTAGGRPQAALHRRRTAPGRSPPPADGPRPLSTAGGRLQAALHGRRTAPGRSPRPADGPRSLSTAGGRPQVALHGRRTAPGRSPRPAGGPAAAPATPADLLKLLPSFLIGLPACWLDLLKNLLIRKNLLLHIATGDNQTL
jgi:hypothetical protein